MVKETYYIKSEGPVKSAVERAIVWLLTSSKETAYIAVMGYGNLQGCVKEVLGEDAVKALSKKDGKIRAHGKTITLITERRGLWDAKDEPIVAFYPTQKFLDEIDAMSNVSAILVVPWIFKDVEPWIRTYNATELNEADKEKYSVLIENRVVVEALKTLSAVVNKSTGLSHPSDRNSAIQTFTKLRDADELYDPGSVKSWLIRYEGWEAPNAEEVAQVAQRVLERRKLRQGTEMFRKDILEIWRKDAEENKGKGDIP